MKTTLQELVDALGNTEKDVANKLVTAGIKGHRKSIYTCPISNYINKFGYIGTITTTHHISTYIRTYTGTDVQEIRTTEPVKNFINAFDHYKYPELEINS